MKKSSYFLALIFTAGMISSAIAGGLNSSDRKVETATQQQSSFTKTTTESAWLNTKNFPMMQQNACPFYIVAKPGC